MRSKPQVRFAEHAALFALRLVAKTCGYGCSCLVTGVCSWNDGAIFPRTVSRSKMDDLVVVPEWTRVLQKSGLDPLGLQAPSIRLYQALVPGISNVTPRTRYYGFYPWLSEEYARR